MNLRPIIELIDALLALKGFKRWSHEANISFLAKIGLEKSILEELIYREERGIAASIMELFFLKENLR